MNSDLKIKDNIDISDIIENKKIKVHFQPIVYTSRKTVCGLEGLVRGINTDTNQLISPIALFEAANDKGLTLELDRICRDKVIEAFSYIYEKDKDRLLFLNIDASIIEKVEGSNYLISQVEKFNVKTSSIVIEINEAKVKDNEALKRFIDTYRKLGFLIALDDIGAGFSNLDRISLIKPDIIKTDMSLIRNVQDDYYKQEVFKSLVTLSNKIGALVVAEGVETEEESIQTLKLGAHMIQGYFFSKPQEFLKGQKILLNNSIENLNDSFKRYMSKVERIEKRKQKQLNTIVNNSLKELVNISYNEFDDKLLDIVKGNKAIECAYIIDKYGIQLSNTVYLHGTNEVKENGIFYSARTGADHSMKKYYYHVVNAKLSKYITEPYVSLATGNLCITFSKIFKNINNRRYILCIDFKY